MKSFKKHLKSVNSNGEIASNKKKPVYRGSAIFPFILNEAIDCRILFMGYWIIKKNISEVGLLCTLRNKNGNILIRKTQQITSPRAYEISIKDLINVNNINFDSDFGSIELEIFSSRDLVFPFPAFVINFYNEKSSTVVHSVGRIYNDFEDLQENSSINVKEGGFDIINDNNIKPFFAFVNGPAKNSSPEISIELISENGDNIKKPIIIGGIKEYEAKFIFLKDHIELDNVLDSRTSTIKISHNFSGFFPRFLSGNLNQINSSPSITHTFYDNSTNDSEDSYWNNDNKDELYDSTVFIPLFLNEDYYTSLKLYPIYSPSDHKISLQIFDINGSLIGNSENFKSIKKTDADFMQIDMALVISDLNLDPKIAKGALLIKEWDQGKTIPTRLKYGLNVGMRDKEFDQPSNICFASHVSNSKMLNKKNTVKWLPLINTNQSVGIIENSSFIKNYSMKAKVDISFYNRFNDESLVRSYEIPPNGQIRLFIDEELNDFSKGSPIWLYIRSNNPFVKGWYFDLNNSGIIGGDHSF